MAGLKDRVARHDREIAEIRRLLLMSTVEHVAFRKDMREFKAETRAFQTEMRAFQKETWAFQKEMRAEHAIAQKEMREIREMIKGLTRSLEGRGNGHEKRRIQ